MKLKYYNSYYRKTYRRIFNYEMFGDQYCYSFKDRMKKILEDPIWYFHQRHKLWRYFKKYIKYKLRYNYEKLFKINRFKNPES